MNLRNSLHDLTTREEQLEQHLLRSTEYLRQLDRQMKRHLAFIYLGITLMLFCLLLFTCNSVFGLPPVAVVLLSVTSILSIASCFLLIRTKADLHRLNLNFLNEQEISTLRALRTQRRELETRLQKSSAERN